MMIIIAFIIFKITEAKIYELGSLIFSFAWPSVLATNTVSIDNMRATYYGITLIVVNLKIRIEYAAKNVQLRMMIEL